ncbi:MAG TPA: P22 phage major capsid protein family protein [Trebonia sp.]
MAFLTAKGIAQTAIALLSRNLVLPMTATRVSGDEFAGSNGDTVTVRVPVPTTARTQASPGTTIDYDTLSETPVDVQLAHLYHATKITDEDMSLALEQFAEQVTLKQVKAVATRAEDQLAGVMNTLVMDLSVATGGADVEAIVLQARELLGENDVPSGDRWLAVSPQFATYLLSISKFTAVNESGNSSALRDAMLGRLYGFNIVESNGLTAGTAVAYHSSGFAFANRSPVVPRGAADSATAVESSIGLRQIFQYDPDSLSDASVVSTFAGAALVDADRVVKITTGGASS